MNTGRPEAKGIHGIFCVTVRRGGALSGSGIETYHFIIPLMHNFKLRMHATPKILLLGCNSAVKYHRVRSTS
jgi:hypothetical protein